MSHTIDHIHGSSRLRRILGLGLSGAALVGLVYVESALARADEVEADQAAWADEVEADIEADEVEADIEAEVDAELDAEVDADLVAGHETTPISVPKPVLAVAPSGPAPAMAIDLAATDLPSEPPAPAVALVTVPDLDGMSLYKARKQLKAVGLKLSVRDEYKEKLPREYWGGYRVRSQKIEAGTEVERGSTVRVRARMRRSYSMGY